MTQHAFLVGLVSAACLGFAIAGCSSSDSKSNGSGGSNAQGGSASAQGGHTSSQAGSTQAGGTSAAGQSSSGGKSSGSGGATANGGAGACTPDLSCKPVAPNTGDPYADCVARVNQFRACVCKPPLAQDTAGQACADQQAAYDAMKDSAHAGFSDGICKPDFFAQNECPGWGSQQDTIDGCAQQMFDEGPGPTDPCEGDCYAQHGHFINMTGDYTKVTCGFAKDSKGQWWTVQNYR